MPRELVFAIPTGAQRPLLSFQAMNPADQDVYFNTPGVASVRWDQGAKLVMVEWEGWADSTEFKELLDAEIRALQAHRGSRVLVDCRQQKVLNPADQERANREWLPRALAAGLKRFAVVLPKSGLAEMNIRDALGKVPDTELQVAYFATVEEGKAWLTG
jgi:hypothetical protein